MFLVNGMNKMLFPECRLPETENELVEKLSCSTDEPTCMNTQCDECSSTGMEPTNFNIGLQSDSDTSSDDDIDETDDAEESTKDSVTYYEWARGDDNKLI